MRLWNAFKRRSRPRLGPSPQQEYEAAVNNTDYSDPACLQSWRMKSVILTGPGAGEERNSEAVVQAGRPVPSRLKGLWKVISSTRLDRSKRPVQTRQKKEAKTKGKGRETKEERHQIDRDPAVGEPGFARAGITWAQPGLWHGRQATFLRLHIEHHRSSHHYLFRVELDVRFWKAGDAAKSQAEVSHLPLDPSVQPTALEMAAVAPEIVFYGPRAAVGRAANMPVDCFWDGHFQPGDNWCYFADVRTPTDLIPALPADDEPRSVLCVYSYGDNRQKIPAPHFTVGMVVLSDGQPFDMTVFSASFYFGRDPVGQYLWSPYKPGKFNSTAQLIPDGEKPLGPSLESSETKAVWDRLVDWSKPYDTIWFGDKSGCIDNERSAARCCASKRCKSCPPHTPAATCELCRKRPRWGEASEGSN